MELSQYVKHVLSASDHVTRLLNRTIDVAVILGTGLAGLEHELRDKIEVNYQDIEHFPLSTAPSHAGKFICGYIDNVCVLCLSGRLHWYEGYSMWNVTFPIRVLGSLGIKKIIISNAAGGISEHFEQGDFVFIRDHINLFPDNPLRGQNHDAWGPRFPDMSQAYSSEGLALASQVCGRLNIKFQQGVYCGFPGPSLETPSEYAYLNKIGGDLVGMSTVPEVLVARHMDIQVIGISLVTNVCYPPERIEETTVEHVIAMAQRKQPEFISLVKDLVRGW